MKKLFLMTIIVSIFTLPAFAIDEQKLDTDTAIIGSFLQRVVNPRNRNYNVQSVAVYCEGYGAVVTFYTYFDSNSRSGGSQFNQDNEELTRGLALYLSGIRQLKENEKVVIVIKNSNQPYQVYTVQAQNNDLISFQQGEIKLDDFAKKIKISQSISVSK